MGEVRMTVAVAAVLAAFLDEPDVDWYGLELMAQSGLASGTLYPILTRLQQAGWAEAHWEDIDPAEAGRPARRYYRLTAEGATKARDGVAALRAKTAPKPSRRRPASEPGVAW